MWTNAEIYGYLLKLHWHNGIYDNEAKLEGILLVEQHGQVGKAFD